MAPRITPDERTYVSVDIDYWLTKKPAILGVVSLMQFADQRRIPLHVVMNHQQLLPFANESDARVLLNIDEHSDIRGKGVRVLDCGSWVSYVNWRKEGTYIWHRNNEDMRGSCNWEGGDNWKYNVDWKKAKSHVGTQNFNIENFLTRAVVGIGICLSPTYTPPEVYAAIRSLIRTRPYYKGWKQEDSRYRECLPPLA